MQWTDEQARAIDARGENILLSAAAGSGKTTVLVARVLGLIEQGDTSVDRMLIVTFTRAASADMRAKLSEKLTARAAEGDARCREQTLLLDRATITTLHGFCAEFLRSHFETAQVDPAFRVLDEAESRRIWDDALDDAIEEAYAEGDEDLLTLDYGRGPKGVREMADGLLHALEERPDPDQWLDRACAMDDSMRDLWLRELMIDALSRIDQAVLLWNQALSHPGCTENYAIAIETDLKNVLPLRKLSQYDDLRRALAEFKPTAARRRAKGAPEVAQEVKDMRDSAKKAIMGAAMLNLPLPQALADVEALRTQIRRLGKIALRAREIIDARKAEISGLSYADLERYALRALADPDTAASLREKYDYVFVDEYQDTSDVQEALINRIVRGNNLFMVGDVKQSIYRFRQAEPRLFLEKYESFGRGIGGRLLNLTMNFRSDAVILDFVNRVFERAMHGGASEIVYDTAARLNAGRGASDGGSVSIHILTGSAENDGDDAQDYIACEREALYIASRIRARMQEDESLRYRDFAVLTRVKSGVLGKMANILMEQGIPAYADGTEGFFESMEISLALSLLKLTANARSDVELIGALRSPVVGLTDADLAQIRIAQPEGPFVDACRSYAQGDDLTADRLRAFFEKLNRWRLMCGNIDLGVLTRTILDESGFYDCAGAMVGGAQRQANLNRLVQNAAEFDRNVSGSLTRFLRHTEKMRARGDGDDAHVLGENDDVVRLMTAHKSKGLEFPVVFGALLGRHFHGGRVQAFSAHRDLGVGCRYCDPQLQTRRTTLPQIAITSREDRETRAEEKRILYVLLTRAQKHLELIGSVKDAEAAQSRWSALRNAPDAADNYLDVIMPAVLDNGVPVKYVDRISNAQVDVKSDDPMQQLLHADCADDALQREMEWKYPYAEDKQPLKLTVTGLLRSLQGPAETDALIQRPAFMAEAGARAMNGAERGTAYHRAMELMDLESLRDLPESGYERAIRARIDAMAACGRMEDTQREAVSVRSIARFFKSEIGSRLLRAQEVRREWSFNVLMRMCEALMEDESAAANADGEILVQGTIDCCFIENDGWVLLDYKTDRETDAAALTDRYAGQLRLYALALERITGLPVREIALILLRSGETVHIELPASPVDVEMI